MCIRIFRRITGFDIMYTVILNGDIMASSLNQDSYADDLNGRERKTRKWKGQSFRVCFGIYVDGAAFGSLIDGRLYGGGIVSKHPVIHNIISFVIGFRILLISLYRCFLECYKYNIQCKKGPYW